MLETYPNVKEIFDNFLSDIVHQLAVAGTYNADAPVVNVEGTSYQHIHGDQGFKVDLKQYTSEIILKWDDIKRLDFSLLRLKIYREAKKLSRERNKDFLDMLTKEGLSIDFEKGSAIDAILTLMRRNKERGFKLDKLQIILSKKGYEKLSRELSDPRNAERYKIESQKIKNGEN
jgi:hypothetical protein